MKPSLLIPLIYLCMMFASPAHAGWFNDLVGGSDAMRVDMRMTFINGVEYKSHDYCDQPISLEQKCILTFVMPPDNIVPRAGGAPGADPTKMVFALSRAKKDADVPEGFIGLIFAVGKRDNERFSLPSNNGQFALYSIVEQSTDEALAKDGSELGLFYNAKTAVGITGFTPNRKKLGTVTFKTSPDDR